MVENKCLLDKISREWDLYSGRELVEIAKKNDSLGIPDEVYDLLLSMIGKYQLLRYKVEVAAEEVAKLGQQLYNLGTSDIEDDDE